MDKNIVDELNRVHDLRKKSSPAKSKAIEKGMAGKKDPRHYRTDMETPEGQKKNAELRKGMKRPESGKWPIDK